MASNLDLNKSISSLFGGQDRAANGVDYAGSDRNDLRSELRSRTFWAVYTLDSYLATMLGKSFTFEERDIGIGYPSLCDDQQLQDHSSREPTETATNLDEDDRPSLMLGPIAHAK